MKRHIQWGLFAGAWSLFSLIAGPANAQLQDVARPPRIQIAGFAGYQWGGSFDTDAAGAVPAGALKLGSSANWGGVVSFLAEAYTAVELWYLHQADNIAFESLLGNRTELPTNGFANNYIHIGARQEFPTHTGLHPFIGGSLGITVFDPQAAGLGTSTRFSFSLGGGLQYMTGPNQRFGIRTDVRWWVTPVPSGDYGVWCGYWSCFAAEGTSWISQGQVSGGLVVAF